MPEIVDLVVATERPMSGLFGDIQLVISRSSVDLTRVSSPAGLALLADHDGTIPLGITERAEVRNGVLYAKARLESSERSEPYIAEIRSTARRGISPGFVPTRIRFEQDGDEILTVIEAFEIYEVSTTPVPLNPDAAIIGIAGSPTAASVSSTSARPAPTAVPAARPTQEIDRRAMTLATQEEKLATQVSKLDERLIDLSRREQALADVEAKPATGAPKPLGEVLLALCSLATNPSGPTPKLPGVEVTSARTNHLIGRIPSMSFSLQSDTVFGSEISTVEAGDIAPEGRGAARLLALCRQTSPPYGSQAFPVLDTGAAASMLSEGSVLAISDGTWRNPPLVARPHQAQARSAFSMQSLVQGGQTFKDMIDQSLRVAMQELIATQLLVGSGVAPSLTGLTSTTGVSTSEYISTNRGTATSFRDAEDQLEDAVYGPEVRPRWLLSTSLWRLARKTLREPGNQEFVLAGNRVLGEHPALKVSDLDDNVAVLADLFYTVLCVWDQMDVVIDMVSKPGNVLTTITSWVDVVVLRPASIIVMDQA